MAADGGGAFCRVHIALCETVTQLRIIFCLRRHSAGDEIVVSYSFVICKTVVIANVSSVVASLTRPLRDLFGGGVHEKSSAVNFISRDLPTSSQ